MILDAPTLDPLSSTDTPTPSRERGEQTTAKPVRNVKRAKVRPSSEDLPKFEFQFRHVRELNELEPYIGAWNRLVEVAAEPNPNMEPWFVIPAIRHLRQHERLEIVLVEAPPRVNPNGPKVLCGIFVFIRRPFTYGLPVPRLESWNHDYCFLGTPLIREDCVREVLDALLHHLGTSKDGTSVVQLTTIDGVNRIHQNLVESNYDHKRCVFVKDQLTRAMFRKSCDVESYLRDNLNRKRRHEIQRLERRLSELGELTAAELLPSDNIDDWIDKFLSLEASGWKAKEGTALASNPKHAAFFREMAVGGFERGQLQMLRIEFEGKPIAMICNLLGREGGLSFKIAYDESAAKHSPGLLMELALIRKLHERNIAWMDSCADPHHPMINHVWPARIVRQSLVLSTGTWLGDLCVSSLSMIRWLKDHAFRRKRRPSATGHLSQSEPPEHHP